MVKLILTNSHETIDYINGEKHYLVRKTDNFSNVIYLMHGKGLPVSKKNNRWFFGTENHRNTNGKIYARGTLVATAKLNTANTKAIMEQHKVPSIGVTYEGIDLILQRSDVPDKGKVFWLGIYYIEPFDYYDFIKKDNDFLITKSGEQPKYTNNELLIDTRLLH